jgi:hypothetical protein
MFSTWITSHPARPMKFSASRSPVSFGGAGTFSGDITQRSHPRAWPVVPLQYALCHIRAYSHMSGVYCLRDRIDDMFAIMRAYRRCVV